MDPTYETQATEATPARPERPDDRERFGRDNPRLPRLEEQLTELRATRARLTREVETLRAHNTDLQATLRQEADELQAPTEQAVLQTRIEEQEEALDRARKRIAYLERRIVEERERAAPAAQAIAPAVVRAAVETPAPRRSRGLRAAAALAVLAAVGAGGALAGAVLEDESPQAAPAPGAQRAATPPRPCSEVPDGADRAVCTTGTVLTIAAGTGSLLLPDLEARVLSALREPAALRVSLRVRNRSEAGQTAGTPGQLYVSVRGRRLVPRVVARPLRVDEAATLELNVPLDAAARRALSTTAGKADLGIVPFAAMAGGATPRQLGVIRLDLG